MSEWVGKKAYYNKYISGRSKDMPRKNKKGRDY